MTSLAYVATSVFGLLLLIYVVRLVSRRKILLGYSLLWMLLPFILIVCPIFPEPMFQLASLMGIELPSNFIFILAIICLMLIALSLSVIASKQTAYSKTLIQEVALLNKEIEDMKSDKRNQSEKIG